MSLEPAYLQTVSRTGGRVTLSLDDTDTPGTDLAMLGATGVDHHAHAPRVLFGWRWNTANGFSVGGQARFMDLEDATAGRASLVPGTTPLPNFATTSETNSLELYTGDLEAALAYRVPQVPVSVFVGRRISTLEGESDSFGRVVGIVVSSARPTRASARSRGSRSSACCGCSTGRPPAARDSAARSTT